MNKHVGFKLDNVEIMELAEFLRIFAEPSRLRILSLLMNRSLCVNHISEFTGMSQSAVSHQLAILRRADIVRTERVGKTMVYSVADEHIEKIISMAVVHIREK